jgi:DNA-binding SARP family transcriptional activator/tetratricopeptide (TPR) repeat protein/energy-coupling factor transporter ATP-binding protein EcfA2
MGWKATALRLRTVTSPSSVLGGSHSAGESRSIQDSPRTQETPCRKESPSIQLVRLLGPIEVLLETGESVLLPSPTQRRIVALLAMHSPNTIRIETLCDVCGVSRGALRKAVSRLRKVLGEALRTETLGYSLDALVDVQQFDRIFRHVDDGTGQAVGHPVNQDRLDEIDTALALWRGDALAEFFDEPWAQPTVTRLTELRSAALDDRAAQLILHDRASEAVAAMENQVSQEPLRDRSRGLLFRALAASGRQTDALRAYQTYREYLALEAGTEPSVAVRDIERRIATGWDGCSEDRRSEPRPLVKPVAMGDSANIAPLPPLLAKITGTSLVGRSRELRALHHEFDKGRSAPGLHCVVIGGESGIGKTTLVATFAQALRAQEKVIFAAGRCDEGESVALKPFREIVTYLVDHASAAVLEEHLSVAGNHIGRLAPNLERRTDIGDLAQNTLDPSHGPSSDLTARYLLFEAVADLLRRFAGQQRLVLVLDDLQWAEPTTLLLLRHLNRALADTNIVVLVTYRDSETDRTSNVRIVLAEFERGHCTRIGLSGLEAPDFAALVAKIAGHHREDGSEPLVLATARPTSSPGQTELSTDRQAGPDPLVLAPAFVKQLFDETAGNPLYTLHLVRQLVESEATKLGRFGLELKRPVEDLELPHSIRDVVWSRVSALGESTAGLLCSAAVLGREFRVETLRSLVDATEHEFDEAVEAGVRSGILQPIRGTQFAQISSGLRFTHAVVAHSLYGELSPFKRQRLHARAAEALAPLGSTMQPELVIALARHFGLAGNLAKGMQWCCASGDQAMSNLAPNEAAQWYEKALRHALDLQVETQRIKENLPTQALPAPPNHEWRIAELTLQLGKAQRLASRREARATLLEAADLAQNLGSIDILVQSALANTRGFNHMTHADNERILVIEAALSALDQLQGADSSRLVPSPNSPNGLDRLVPSRELDPMFTVGSRPTTELLCVPSNWPGIRARLLALLSQELLHTSDGNRRRAAAEESLKIATEGNDKSLLARIAPGILNGLWEPGGASRSSEIAAMACTAVDSIDEPWLAFRVFNAAFSAAVQNADHVSAREAWRRAMQAAKSATDPILHWPLALKEVFEATMSGELRSAESLAAVAYSLGEEAGEPDALLVFAVQISSIRAAQCRNVEIMPHIEEAAASNPENLSLQLFFAITCLDFDRTEEARLVLQRGAELDFTHVSTDLMWTSTMVLYAIIAESLGDVTIGARLLELLEPFASEICFNGATSLGSLSGHVGNLASLVGRHDDAERYLLHALEVHRNFGWAFHEVAVLIGLARARRARFGLLDAAALNWLSEASVIAEAKGLLRATNSIAKMRESK